MSKDTQENPTSFRLTLATLTLIRVLAKKMGISQAAVVTIAVRKLAAQEGVKTE